MVALPTDRHTDITVEQYLALEADAQVRHEYYHGEIIAMSGARRNHAVITLNIASVIRAQLSDRPDCTAVSSDMRVRVSESIYFYPDVVVACDEQYADAGQSMLLNPSVVVEVASESTRLYDKTTKLEAYKLMPSVQDVLIVDQYRVGIEQHTRMADGWFVQTFSAENDEVSLKPIGCVLTVRDVYAKVAFEA